MKTKVLGIVFILVLVLSMVACKQPAPTLPKPTEEEVGVIVPAASRALVQAVVTKATVGDLTGYIETREGEVRNQKFTNCTVTIQKTEGGTEDIVLTGTSKLSGIRENNDVSSAGVAFMDFTSVKVGNTTYTISYTSSPEKLLVNGHDFTSIILR